MRRLIIFSILLAVYTKSVTAQEYQIRMIFKDGRVMIWPVSDIDYIDFPMLDKLATIYKLSVISDEVIWDNEDHCAFTCLTEFGGEKLLAFREGLSHRPTSVDDYGHITVLKESGREWVKMVDLSHPEMDLRDPFFVTLNGHLRMYCGYNQFVDGKYQHSGTAYADLTETKWSEFTPIQHDVPHITWLWKIRKFKDSLYGVGYLEGEKPVLLSSQDGVNWNTVTTFQLDGILSEADIVFIEDSMYVCLRQDTPVGSPSWWGKSIFPFDDFEWRKMDVSIASPDICSLGNSNQMLLAGREYAYYEENKEDSIKVSIFEVDNDGVCSKIYSTAGTKLGDKGYPSFYLFNDEGYMSYYEGNTTTSKIKLAHFKIIPISEDNITE